MASVADPIPHTCVNCHRPLGIANKIIPHFIAAQGHEGAPDSPHESWCPVCFVKVRAHKETLPHGNPRFAADFSMGHRHPVHGRTPAMMRAIKCRRCGNESLSMGHLGCMQCPPPAFGKPHQDFLVLQDSHFAAIVAGAKNVLAGNVKPGESSRPLAPGAPEKS
jgi:ribosomal protein L37E